LVKFDLCSISMTDVKFLAELGHRIKKVRLRKGMTQNELAVRCEFEKASMSRIESGKTNLTLLTLRKITKALDVDFIELFKD
jgi:transcriptional regulator with XRE-family HTH domain